MSNTSRIFFSVNVIIGALAAGCSGETTFNGNSKDVRHSPAVKSLDGASTAQLPTPVPVLPTPPENPLNALDLAVPAKSIASADLIKTGVMIADVNVDTTTLPAGHLFDKNTGVFRLQSDLQDIGMPTHFSVSASFEDEIFSADGVLNVIEPKVATTSCSYRPNLVIGALAPVQKWHWAGWTPGGAVPSQTTTYSSPVVGDLDNDGTVEVISIPSTAGSYFSVNGPLVVLNGKTGESVWNSLEAMNQGAMVSTTPAIIDLDNDGFAEIIFSAYVGGSATAKELIAIDFKTKTIKWRFSNGFSCATSCIVAVADIDGNGTAEIVAGNVILNSDGTLKAMLTPAPADAIPSTVSIADIDPSVPGLELVVNGSQVYKADGTRLWAGACRGYSAVADLDRDNSQEVVCVGGGKVIVYAKDGTQKWAKDIPVNPALAPLTLLGGAPNIGNFSGDDDLEVGTAGGDYYVVYNANGTELWKQETTDRSSHRTGSTIFDFNGDGKVEVIYNDEQKLRIYDGATGTVLWETANPSGTLWEYPVVANIDDDDSVEIIVSSPGLGGVRAFDDPSNLWVSSRRLWNQYSYYPEIVSDSLKAVAAPGTPSQGFRINRQGAIRQQEDILLSDLTAMTPFFPDQKDLEVASTADGRRNLTFYVMNQGQAKSADRITVELLDEAQVSLGRSLMSDAIAAGAGRLIKIETGDLSESIGKPLTLRINYDASGMLQARECQSANNAVVFSLSENQRATVAP